MWRYSNADEALHRGEVLLIVAYMRWRMKQFKYIEHYTFPVNGERLHISKGIFHDFQENVKENYQLFIQWVHGIPCGRTETPLSIKDEKLDNQTKKDVESFLDYLFKQANTPAADGETSYPCL
ncbi:hypothetical protein BDV29DRAFT_194542 [Aspergillus leporis]|uniref:Uncharacterized protein n=1 Tax=Aspergillus leporis TaxID=41062 RepID=A0A5N5WRZ9_9EURO|nr:hypothetical protein BDV29DRAFT_194542 [Aspergillus leporis]